MTLPLQLLLNCSSLESTRPRIGAAAFEESLLPASLARRLRRRVGRKQQEQQQQRKRGEGGRNDDEKELERDKDEEEKAEDGMHSLGNEGEEDFDVERGRILSYATLANLSRSIECRQQIYVRALAAGMGAHLPGVVSNDI